MVQTKVKFIKCQNTFVTLWPLNSEYNVHPDVWFTNYIFLISFFQGIYLYFLGVLCQPEEKSIFFLYDFLNFHFFLHRIENQKRSHFF